MSNEKPTLTDVDLGDDLLESTRTYTLQLESEKVEGPLDKMASAQILFAEGLGEDAKKLLRSILLNDLDRDHWAEARARLDKILKHEIAQILSSRTGSSKKEIKTKSISEREAHEIEERWGVIDSLESEERLF